MQVRQTKLPNGLRIVTTAMPGFRTTAVAIGVGTGGRHESSSVAGLSHFLEHLLFKGTKRYPSAQIINEAVDSVGGDNNAYTNHDQTVYYIKVPGRHWQLAVNILCDMMATPLFDPDEVDRERGPVIEEMNQRNDNPSHLVCDLVLELLYPCHPLGQTVLGSEDIINSVSADVVRAYQRHHYQPRNMVVSLAGMVDHDAVVAEVTKALGDFRSWEPDPITSPGPKPSASLVHVLAKDTAQAHLLLGLRTFGASHADVPALSALDGVLSTGMSSRLFARIREQQGLAYSVSSFFSSHADVGTFYAYVGANLEKSEQALTSLVDELMLTATEFVSVVELEKAKQQLIADAEQGPESNLGVALGLSQELLMTGRHKPIDENIAEIEAVTVEDVRRVAQGLFVPTNMRLAIVAPADYGARLSQHFRNIVAGL